MARGNKDATDITTDDSCSKINQLAEQKNVRQM
jgi:hypothetical protein